MIQFKKSPLAQQRSYRNKYGTSFQAGHYKWKIVYCHDLHNDGNRCYGVCNPKNKTIYIDINEDGVEDTLIHEMFHAECYEVGLYTMPSWNADLEELASEAASRLARNFDLRRKNGRRRTKPK